MKSAFGELFVLPPSPWAKDAWGWVGERPVLGCTGTSSKLRARCSGGSAPPQRDWDGGARRLSPSPVGAACPSGAAFLPRVSPHVPPKLLVPTQSPLARGRSGVPLRPPPPGAAGRLQARRALAYWFIELLQGTAGTRWWLGPSPTVEGGRQEGTGQDEGRLRLLKVLCEPSSVSEGTFPAQLHRRSSTP